MKGFGVWAMLSLLGALGSPLHASATRPCSLSHNFFEGLTSPSPNMQSTPWDKFAPQPRCASSAPYKLTLLLMIQARMPA